ncbi:transporter [uncultured Gemella sp.]|uniref:transporter n=1 Tax=uncultured Gemella sp. TaxID=254352 RepID=UPI0028D09A92|nr:transporter [uncultured Gemella sp.]
MDNKLKRAELLEKYNNWINKNKKRLIISFIIYVIIISLNLLLLKNNKITILSSLLFFTYAIYVFSLIWFINNKLILNIDSVDFDVK